MKEITLKFTVSGDVEINCPAGTSKGTIKAMAMDYFFNLPKNDANFSKILDEIIDKKLAKANKKAKHE